MSPDPVGRFLSELQRRKVFRVGIAYAVFAAAAIQLADVIIPHLGGTDGTVTLVIRIALIGFPISLLLAWIYDITDAGISRTDAGMSTMPEDTGSADDRSEQHDRGTTRARRPIWSLTAALVALIAIVWTSFFLVSRSRADSAFDMNRFAVLPFRVEGRPDIKYLDEGLVDLLSTKLNGAAELSAVDPKPLLGFLRRSKRDGDDDQALGRRVSEQFGSGLFISGTVVQTGSRLQLIASLYDHTGRLLVDRATATCAEEELSAGLDELARQLFRGTRSKNEGAAGDLASITTDSLRALKAYLRAVRFMRAANAPAAVDDLNAAIAIDSSFGLAYLRLSDAQSWMPRISPEHNKAEETALHILAHMDRLSPLDRTLGQTTVYQIFYTDARRAVASASSILERRPDNIDALYALGETQFHWALWIRQPILASRKTFARVITLDPGFTFALEHLSDIAILERDTIALDTLIPDVARKIPDRADFYREMWTLAKQPTGGEQSIPRAWAKVSDEELTDNAWRAIALIPTIQTLNGAATALLQSHRSARTHDVGEQYLASADLARGRVNSGVARIIAGLQTNKGPDGSQGWRLLAYRAMLIFPYTADALRAEFNADQTAPLTSPSAGGSGLTAVFLGNEQRVTDALAMLESVQDSVAASLTNTNASPKYVQGLKAVEIRLIRGYRMGSCDVVLHTCMTELNHSMRGHRASAM